MLCPKCRSKSRVTKTFFKFGKTIRYRKCNNKKCGHPFQSTEYVTYGWDDRAILLKIQELVREVK